MADGRRFVLVRVFSKELALDKTTANCQREKLLAYPIERFASVMRQSAGAALP